MERNVKALLTPDAIVTLFSGTLEDKLIMVQVTVVWKGTTPSGVIKYTVTVSDGAHCLDCVVMPQLMHLFVTKAVSTYTIITLFLDQQLWL